MFRSTTRTRLNKCLRIESVKKMHWLHRLLVFLYARLVCLISTARFDCPCWLIGWLVSWLVNLLVTHFFGVFWVFFAFLPMPECAPILLSVFLWTSASISGLRQRFPFQKGSTSLSSQSMCHTAHSPFFFPVCLSG